MTIDYRSIPEVQQLLNKLEGMRQNDDDMLACFGRTLLPNAGDEIWLRVTISDPALAQLVLLSLFYEPYSINLPGLELVETSQPGEREREAVKEWLDYRLKEMW